MYLVSALFGAAVVVAFPEHPPGPGQRLAAQYVARWAEPPSDLARGRLSSAPFLGNGDLGVSLGGALATLRVAPTTSAEPPGPSFAVGFAKCDGSDRRQLWAGEALTTPGLVSQIENLDLATAGICLSAQSVDPVVLSACGHGDTSWVYHNTSLWLEVGPGTSRRGGCCLDADSHSSKAKPRQPGFALIDTGCQPMTEQYIFTPAPPGSGGVWGLLRPRCPPAVPAWQCPGLDDQCLTVVTAAPPPPPPPPAPGQLTLHLGLNQLWGLREYNRCMPGNRRIDCVPFEGDTKFPRRLAFGGLTVAPANGTEGAALLADATFTAEMRIATAEVKATLTSPSTGASLTVSAVLAPGRNEVLTTVSASPRRAASTAP